MILMQVCILPFFTHLLIASTSFSMNKNMPTFSNKKPITSLGRKLQIKSTLGCPLVEQEKKQQEPQDEQSTSSTNHLSSGSNAM
jgi:hypothetical protein